MCKKTFHNHQKTILPVVDALWEECLAAKHAKLHAEEGRTILVRCEDHFFIKHKERLLQLMEGDYGMKVGAALKCGHDFLGCSVSRSDVSVMLRTVGAGSLYLVMGRSADGGVEI